MQNRVFKIADYLLVMMEEEKTVNKSAPYEIRKSQQ